MDADAIFNSIANRNLYERMKAYNDTVDPRRTWTLCGRLLQVEKERLKMLIRMHGKSDHIFCTILDVIDGSEKLIENVDWWAYTYRLTLYQHVMCISRVPWIHHNNQPFIDRVTNFYKSSKRTVISKADYIVLTDYVDRDDYIGTPIFPAVAEIIMAEITLGKTSASIEWLRDSDDDYTSNDQKLRYAEDYMRGNRRSRYNYWSDVTVSTLIDAFPECIDSLTLEEVKNCFTSVNRLIPLRCIWRHYETGLIKCVDASMTEIISSILSSQLLTGGLTNFWSVPVDRCDIDIITIV